MNSKVVICGVDTSKIPRIKSSEMDRLFREYKKENSKDAREKLIYYNYRLVLSITHRFCPKKDNIDDIFQVGVIGLIKAINNFDISYNLKFSTYAVPMISGEIKRYLRDDSFMKISRSIKDLAYQILKFKEAFALEKMKEPTVDDILKEFKQPKRIVLLALDSGNEPTSLYEKVYDNGGESALVIDQVRDQKNSFENQMERLALKGALAKLDKKEMDIVNRRYFEGKTQVEVSSEIGISQAQVSRLEKNALKTLQINL